MLGLAGDVCALGSVGVGVGKRERLMKRKRGRFLCRWWW